MKKKELFNMIAFSIMMWFCSTIIIFLSISLLRANYAGIHGNMFDNSKDKERYAKAIGKPALLMGAGIAIVGILVIAIQGLLSVIISILVLILLISIVVLWFIF